MQSSKSAAVQPRKTMSESMVAAADPVERAWTGLVGKEISFPHGLFGFPDHHRYRLQPFNPADGSESPFFILASVDGQLSFPLIHPDFLGPDYHLPISFELLTDLNAKSAADVVSLLIVTVRDRVEETTVNLQGPLVINADAFIGMQIVVEKYPLRHSLLRTTAD